MFLDTLDKATESENLYIQEYESSRTINMLICSVFQSGKAYITKENSYLKVAIKKKYHVFLVAWIYYKYKELNLQNINLGLTVTQTTFGITETIFQFNIFIYNYIWLWYGNLLSDKYLVLSYKLLLQFFSCPNQITLELQY